jgi:hypothetical protein
LAPPAVGRRRSIVFTGCDESRDGRVAPATAEEFMPEYRAMLDVPAALARLCKTRPVFHSEADFQHALAWDIHEHHPEAAVRLEFRPRKLAERAYIDLWFSDETLITAMEVKYKTRRLTAEVNGELFELLNHGAHDHGRYDVLWDVRRLEEVVAAYPTACAFAVLLTNDSYYWTAGKRQVTIDAAFRLHEASRLQGTLGWAAGTGEGTAKGREQPIALTGCYECRWRDYAVAGGDTFRYLLMPITSEGATINQREAQ